MGGLPFSDTFSFDTLLSENNLTQAWIGTDKRSGAGAFLKVPSIQGGLGREETKQILSKSYRCQTLIRSANIITARDIHVRANHILIEYPLFERARWQQLQADHLRSAFVPILTQISIIVDYLHLLGLVHCDLKLENFQIDLTTAEPRVLLLDLDCLTQSGAATEARLIGTPGHMAPELLRDSAFTTQTDNFSLGRSLERHLPEIRDTVDRQTADIACSPPTFERFVASLTNKTPVQRPASLIEGMYQHELIQKTVYGDAKRTLLSMLMIGKFRRFRSELGKRPDSIQRFLREEIRLIGLPAELCQDMERAMHVSPLSTWRFFKELLAKCEINRYGDVWHVIVTDDTMLDTFDSLEQISGGQDRDPGVSDRASSYRQYLRAARAYRMKPPSHTGPDQKVWVAGLKNMVKTSLEFDRAEDAVKYLKDGLRLVEPGTETSLWILSELALQLYRLNEVSECEQLMERCLSEAKTARNRVAELDFLRISAWTHGIGGRHDTEREILQGIIQSASTENHQPQLVRGYSALGMVESRTGNDGEAERLLLESIRIAKEAGVTSELGYCLLRLSHIYQSFSSYRKSLAYGRLASKYFTGGDSASMTIHQHNGLILALVRLGEYRKAEYWFGRLLDLVWEFNRPTVIARCFSNQGWMEANRGRLSEAKDWLLRALSIVGPDTIERTVGKIYFNLAEIAVYQGERTLCDEYVVAARNIFQTINDRTAQAEIEFVAHLNVCSHDETPSPETLVEHLESLLDANCHWDSLLCLFHILQTSDSGLARKAIKLAAPVAHLYEKPETPLAKALKLIVRTHQSSRQGEARRFIGALKAAYGFLQAAGHTYLALVVCRRIATLYFQISKDKLARKFLQQAIRLAETIGNSHAVEKMSMQSGLDPDLHQDRTRVLQVFLGISNILKDIKDYDRAMQQVVEFAVEETGAERGVFLVKEKQASNLYVKSFVNCDDESLMEITDFSRTLPERVVDDLNPLVIDDALKDSTTRRLQSIVAHNIRSVMCIPVTMPGSFFGVLYLDHHTIPALFDQNDITFVRAMANSLSVVISTIEQFRGINVVRQSLRDDLANYGITSPLVTRNKKMRTMVKKIPQIAATSASILLTGESGTGKEILCQMIHDNSPRRDRPLVKLNCAAMAPSMIESELFGIAKNVATGVSAREGKFEAADGGTLFLDEIGDMQLEVQAKLLRVVEHQGFERVGSNRTVYADVRLIYATNKDLKDMVARGKFRQDLYYRLYTIDVKIPPLRERPDDIELLIGHFVNIFSPYSGDAPRFSGAAMDSLTAYYWPGNVRELRNLVERICILRTGEIIEPKDLSSNIRDQRSEGHRNSIGLEAIERTRMLESLKRNGWNQSRAAADLNMPLTTFRRKIKKHKITRDQ